MQLILRVHGKFLRCLILHKNKKGLNFILNCLIKKWLKWEMFSIHLLFENIRQKSLKCGFKEIIKVNNTLGDLKIILKKVKTSSQVQF